MGISQRKYCLIACWTHPFLILFLYQHGYLVWSSSWEKDQTATCDTESFARNRCTGTYALVSLGSREHEGVCHVLIEYKYTVPWHGEGTRFREELTCVSMKQPQLSHLPCLLMLSNLQPFAIKQYEDLGGLVSGPAPFKGSSLRCGIIHFLPSFLPARFQGLCATGR